MFLGMRDVILWKTIENPWEMLNRQAITKMEVRIDQDLSLQFINDTPLSIATDEGREKILSHLEEKKVSIAGILLLTKFSGELDEYEWIKQSAKFASSINVRTIRVDHWRDIPASAEEREELLVTFEKRLAKVLDLVSEYGVTLALENHGPLSNQPDTIRRLIDRFAAKGFRICFDTGNFYVTGGLPLSEIYKVAEEFAPYTTSAHLKNASYPIDVREEKRDIKTYPYGIYSTPIEKGDIDHARLFEIFKKAGYQGCFFYEDEVLYHLEKTLSYKLGSRKNKDIMNETLAYLKQYLKL
jgi:sugar phosphate isomerase/epimerase